MPSEVVLTPRPIDRWCDILSGERWDSLEETLRLARSTCEDRPFWCVNSTGAGGGVAEMLRTMLGYFQGVGLDARWAVIDGDPEFFAITKRLHNFVHGHPGDGGVLDWRERNIYHRVMHANAAELTGRIPAGSLVVLHDPQTAGLVGPLRQHGCTVVWRCHIGAEQRNGYTREAWDFLEPFVADADRFVFSRALHVPDELAAGPAAIISPSIDPFAPKNQRLDEATVRAILTAAGLLRNGGGDPVFYRLSGQTARVERLAVILAGGPLPDGPVVLQVSRWDRLKDHSGVMRGFVRAQVDADLVLVGPHAEGVADDPEGAQVLQGLLDDHAALPTGQRNRVHIVSLPMADVEENAAVVNALQRYATVVVQKSLQEGFGLTVTEALWKSKPMIASGVGGICDQISHNGTGILLDDPADEAEFAGALTGLLADPGQLGVAAQRDVYERFLHDRHIRRWLSLFAGLDRRG